MRWFPHSMRFELLKEPDGQFDSEETHFDSGWRLSGAYTALHLEKRLANERDVEIMLVSRENFVLFTPMLHEVAGADVSVTDIVQPLRKMLRHTRVAIADVEAIDLAKRQVRIRHGDLPTPYDVTYDQLVLALGAVT